jgi:pectin methylesterase-like acyl-CoA thioesterase
VEILTVGDGGTYATIQAAINAAASGDTILIAAGTYREQITVNAKDLTVHGAGNGVGGTIIEAPDAASLVINAIDSNAARPNKFDGQGAAAGDSLSFVGYGPGATFTQNDAAHWQIDYNGGASHDVITFSNAASIHASDFLFT